VNNAGTPSAPRVNVGLIGAGFMGKAHSLAYAAMPMFFWPAPALPHRRMLAELDPGVAREAAVRFGFEESTMGKTRAAYPPEFRRQMVDLVRAGGSPEELAREFEPTAQSIRNWLAQSERNAGRGDGGLTTAEREELNRLRRENRQLRLEREILSKAAAWFARETNTIPHKGSSS